MQYQLMLGLVSALTLVSAHAATLQGLGRLPGANASYAWSVSGDGSIVVGQSMDLERSEAVRWTADGQIHGLGHLPGGNNSLAKGASRDGSVIVGISTQYDSDRGEITGWWAFRWTSGTGMRSLGVGTAHKVNADGTVVVGDNGSKACRWVDGIGTALAGVDSIDCRDVSDDGQVVVGTVNERAYRWTPAQGPVDVGTLPGDQFAEAYGISADGMFVVGVSYDRLPQAFRWSETAGMIGLGSLSPSDVSRANSVSADGSVVVGLSSGAFVWDYTHGIRSVSEVLKSQGADLTDWFIEEATAVSDDGRTLVGNGVRHTLPEAWVARVEDLTLPELSVEVQGANTVLSWPGLKEFPLWRLQWASQVGGPWIDTDAPSAWSDKR